MRRDIAQFVTCVAIVLQPGGQGSRGATLEHHIARALGMQVERYAVLEGGSSA